MTKEEAWKGNYLTEEESKMPLDMALLQISIGLQTCKTKDDVKDLLMDAVLIGERRGRNK